MRVKGSSTQDGGVQHAALPGAAPLLAPYRLVGSGDAGAARPAIAGLPSSSGMWQQQNSTVRQLAHASSSASMQSVESAGQQVSATGRMQRKRKPSFANIADDMLPTDVLKRRSAKPRTLAALHLAPLPPVANPEPSAAPAPVKSEPTRAPAGVLGGQLSSPPLLDLTTVAPSLMPYSLVTPTGSGSDVPVVQVASAWDIVQLRKQMEEEERRRASEVLRAQQQALEDARVVLRVLPGEQAAGQGVKGSRLNLDGKEASLQGSQVQRQAAAARRAARASRRATPDLDPTSSLPPGMWHPGLSVHDGVGYVDTLQYTQSQLVPPVLVVDTPPRFAQPSGHKPQPPEFSDDPVHASVEYLKYLATNTCRLPTYGGQLQQAVNAEQRLYKERIRRLHYARDGRKMAKERAEGTRKSARARQAPEVFMPVTSGRKASKPLDVMSPVDETDSRLGEEFQAELPAVRSKPAGPTVEEARWLEGLVLEAGSTDPPIYSVDELMSMGAATQEERAPWLERARLDLSAVLGADIARSLGLDAMGMAYIGVLSAEEEMVLHAGFKEHGREFHAVQAEFVPTRTVHQLINHYYNIWKLKATLQARLWFAEKEQEEIAYQQELQEQERKAEAERQKRADKQRTTYERRMLREVVGWIKAAARNPNDVNWNKPAVRDRALRASNLIGCKNAQPDVDAGSA